MFKARVFDIEANLTIFQHGQIQQIIQKSRQAARLIVDNVRVTGPLCAVHVPLTQDLGERANGGHGRA